MVRYLYRSGEDEGGERRRATDSIWSLEVFHIDRIVVKPDEPVLYYLMEGSESVGRYIPPRRSFVREELQVVPKDTELPPDHVLKL